MTTHVDVFVGPSHDLVHTSLVLTGFCALASRAKLSLRYHYPAKNDRWLVNDPMVIVIDIHSAKTVRVAIDLRDGEGISQPIIDRVRWYLKRAYSPAERQALGGERGGKILPFGLNYGCRSLASTMRLLATVGPPIAWTGRFGFRRLKHYLLTPTAWAFEQSPNHPVEPWVAFQTRLWTEDEVASGEAAPLNAERVTIVRGLKREFGAQFIGGLVPTAYARQNYPDDLTPHSSKYADYLRLKKRCLISVYTRGVEHSLAFKLGETFAASQCLVSVPLRYELPEPIAIGRHYLEFETLDGCIAACRRLLGDRELAQAMRRANHDYYRREVEPLAHGMRVMERVAAAESAS